MTVTDEQLDQWGKKILRAHKESGDPWDSNWIDFLEGLSNRTKKNLDAIVTVAGRRGLGKTTFAINSALVCRQFGLDFSLSDIYYGERSLAGAVEKISKHRNRVYIFDEIIDLAYSRNAMTVLNKNLSRFFTKVRKMNNIVFLCIPRFKNLDTSLRNDAVHFWVEVFWRGECSMHRMSNNPSGEDPWGLEDKRVKLMKAYTQRDYEKLMGKYSSFKWFMKYPKMPAVIEKSYLQTSEAYLEEAGKVFIDSFTKKKPQPKPAEIKK